MFYIVIGCVSAYKNRRYINFIIYNFTKIIITTPLLTKILDRLIKGDIILYSNII
jgi:hypothetical protein